MCCIDELTTFIFLMTFARLGNPIFSFKAYKSQHIGKRLADRQGNPTNLFMTAWRTYRTSFQALKQYSWHRVVNEVLKIPFWSLSIGMGKKKPSAGFAGVPTIVRLTKKTL